MLSSGYNGVEQNRNEPCSQAQSELTSPENVSTTGEGDHHLGWEWKEQSEAKMRILEIAHFQRSQWRQVGSHAK